MSTKRERTEMLGRINTRLAAHFKEVARTAALDAIDRGARADLESAPNKRQRHHIERRMAREKHSVEHLERERPEVIVGAFCAVNFGRYGPATTHAWWVLYQDPDYGGGCVKVVSSELTIANTWASALSRGCKTLVAPQPAIGC